ncbi:MAG: hypothetical protein PHW25_01500 [Zoogloea sp.]|jgi:hypothetical protein|uniref:hypothetical protein n=1 Tax=Zoogloea sp. TaxID=49181 RepID=UPI002604B216|nr:hypothetical protein [Zoogloea sp.]MDD3325744.1 hypothetical protein [Zoogloea sp.]
MLKLIQVLWPSFIVAGIAEIVFFTVVSPQELYFMGDPVRLSAIATYSIGFLCLWLICAGSSLATLFFQRTSEEINRSDLD